MQNFTQASECSKPVYIKLSSYPLLLALKTKPLRRNTKRAIPLVIFLL